MSLVSGFYEKCTNRFLCLKRGRKCAMLFVEISYKRSDIKKPLMSKPSNIVRYSSIFSENHGLTERAKNRASSDLAKSDKEPLCW
jgi:hypothetical protein